MITIKNLKNEKPQNPWDVKVDRSSPLGNPFFMKDESEREKVCDQYEEWFRKKMWDKTSDVWIEMHRIQSLWYKHGKLNLFCWCHPRRCHAETIKTWLACQ